MISEPPPVRLGEAVRHILVPLRAPEARRPLVFTAALAVVVLVFLFGLRAIWAVLGVPLAFALITAGYLCWQDRLRLGLERHGPLCKRCEAPLWDVGCARCQEPVPQLSLWLSSLFLERCPHCDEKLSAAGGTLHAVCLSCGETEARPDQLLANRCDVVVWIATNLPRQTDLPGWQLVSKSDARRLYAREGSPPALLYLCRDWTREPPPLSQIIFSRADLVLVSSDVELADAKRGLFHRPRVRVDRVPPLADVESGT